MARARKTCFLFAAAPGVPFLVGAVALIASAVLVLALRGSFTVTRSPRLATRHLLHEIGEGVRWLAPHRLLRTLSLTLGLRGRVRRTVEGGLVRIQVRF